MTPPAQKFLIVDDWNDYGQKNLHVPRCVWVTNYTWYNENEYEIDRWLLKHGCIMPGMIIKFPSEEALTLFLLRWQ